MPCPRCEGCGNVELPEHLARTLTCVPTRGEEPITATEVYLDLVKLEPGLRSAAVIERLQRLAKLRLVVRSGMGGAHYPYRFRQV
jgi:Fe2+ or Zn2+ uptake regulation protein